MKHHKNKLDNDDSILCEESLINMENGISFFYNEIESRDLLLERIKKYVEELYKLEGKNIYLILVGSYGFNEKLCSYYKLWKAVSKEYSMNDFLLGTEYSTIYQDKQQYCGAAQINKDDIMRCLDILLDYQYSGFLLITNRKIQEYKSDMMLGSMCIVKDLIYQRREINWVRACTNLENTEIVVKITSDGEEVAAYLMGKI